MKLELKVSYDEIGTKSRSMKLKKQKHHEFEKQNEAIETEKQEHEFGNQNDEIENEQQKHELENELERKNDENKIENTFINLKRRTTNFNGKRATSQQTTNCRKLNGLQRKINRQI